MHTDISYRRAAKADIARIKEILFHALHQYQIVLPKDYPVGDIAIGKTYLFNDNYPFTWAEYLETLGSWIGKAPTGGMPFWLAWALGSFCEKVLVPLGIRPPMTRLAAGVMGRNLNVDASRARQELGWESRVSQDEAMERIKAWVATRYA